MCISLASSSLYLLSELLIPLFLPKPPTTSSKQVSHLPLPHNGWVAGGERLFQREDMQVWEPCGWRKGKEPRNQTASAAEARETGEEAGEAGRQAGPQGPQWP